jgi:8-amino-7-oxononanoate synthase
MVDDAHGTLTLGAFGGGIGELTGTSHSIDVHTGTLSKAIGSIGGFVACSSLLKTYLVNTARGYTFSTSLPIPAVAAALEALDVFKRCASMRVAWCLRSKLCCAG